MLVTGLTARRGESAVMYKSGHKACFWVVDPTQGDICWNGTGAVWLTKRGVSCGFLSWLFFDTVTLRMVMFLENCPILGGFVFLVIRV